MAATTLILYLKAPRQGYSKTRLAKTVGPSKAVSIYKALVSRQIRAIPTSQKLQIDYAPANAEAELRQWLGDSHAYRSQIEGDLGSKLQHSFESTLANGASYCLCIGGDCPGLQEKHCLEAEVALQKGADLVIGPCEDGGYYLIGLKQSQPELFQEIPWSTPETLEATLKKAANLSLKVHTLETLYDVDDNASYQRAIKDAYLPE